MPDGGAVAYSAALKNSGTADSSGHFKDGVTLSFQAYMWQTEKAATPQEARGSITAQA